MKIAVLFPGQGSQYIGMGQEFIDSDKSCADIMDLADSVCDFPLKDLCLDGPMEELTRAVHLQPALTVTNLICWQALRNALNKNHEISCFAGHSLGEYSALCAAGVLSVEDTINLVRKRGALMEREGKKNPGYMHAVLGLTIEEVEDLINNNSSGIVVAANHNTAQQIVIAGDEDALQNVGNMAKEKGAKVIPLNVSVANHSPLVAGAVPDFTTYMSNKEFNTPKTNVYFNVSSALNNNIDEIRDMMSKQIISRVRWYEIINNMLADGIDTFIEVGPKTVLKGMMRKIVPKGVKVLALQVDSPVSLAKCLKKLES